MSADTRPKASENGRANRCSSRHPTWSDGDQPKLSGYEVCRRLKQDPETRDIYIVMLTARGQQEDEQKALELGADEFMTKPFSPRKMRAKLEEVLGPPA